MQDLAQTKPFFQDLLSKEEEQKKKNKITNIPNKINNKN